MCERAIELLLLPEDQSRLLLDIGCESGLSSNALEDQGHVWIGVDISSAMLEIATERETDGDLILRDIGQGLPFKAGEFDGAVSISAFNGYAMQTKLCTILQNRLYRFFSSLYVCLSRSARAVLQFYPESNEQVELITAQATKVDFFSGVIVDFPNSAKAKKYS